MQFKVPQNIDQEDKILGPLTFIQFIYVLIGGGIILASFALFDFSLFLLVSIPVFILTVCFSLIKVQDQPFSHFFVALLLFLTKPRIRLWHQQEDSLLTAGQLEDEKDAEKEVEKENVKIETDAPKSEPLPKPEKPARKLSIMVQSS